MKGTSWLVSLLQLLCAACGALVVEGELPGYEGGLFHERSLGQTSFHTEAERLVFFAVLEGAYVDGVRADATARLIERGEEMDWPRWFVYSCPVCMPAFDALRVYGARPGFFGDKLSADTFGPGLSSERRARLFGEDERATRAVVEELVAGWTQRYLARMELSSEERERIEAEFSKMREVGTEHLQQYLKPGSSPLAAAGELDEGTRKWSEAARRHYAGWERCPSCEGAQEAGEWRPRALR